MAAPGLAIPNAGRGRPVNARRRGPAPLAHALCNYGRNTSETASYLKSLILECQIFIFAPYFCRNWVLHWLLWPPSPLGETGLL